MARNRGKGNKSIDRLNYSAFTTLFGFPIKTFSYHFCCHFLEQTEDSLHATALVWTGQLSFVLKICSLNIVQLSIPIMLCMYLCYICFSPEIFKVLNLSLCSYLIFYIWIYVFVFVSEFIFSSGCISLKAVFVQLDEPAVPGWQTIISWPAPEKWYLYLYFKSFVCATGWSDSAWRWQTIISWLAPGIKILPTGRHNYQNLIWYNDTLLIISIKIKIKILPPGRHNH